MKKEYIHPTMVVIEYNACQPILTGSFTLNEINTGTQYTREGIFDIDQGELNQSTVTIIE